MNYRVGQEINHRVHGKGIITNISVRTWEKDRTTDPIIEITFEKPIRILLKGEEVYTARFTDWSLAEFITE